MVADPESTVAIIGTGNIGGTLAAEFAAGGRDFLLAGRYGALGRVVTRSEALNAL
jgi:predicted dinucleotide-binding enzyme